MCCFGLSQFHEDLCKHLGLKGSKVVVRLVSKVEFVQGQLEAWNESRRLYAAHTSCVFGGD